MERISMPEISIPAASADPKRMHRLLEAAYSGLTQATTHELLLDALRRTRQLLGGAIQASCLLRRRGTEFMPFSPADEIGLSRLRRFGESERETLTSERCLVSASEAPAAAWLLGARSEWLAIFLLERTAAPEEVLVLTIGRLLVQHRLAESDWNGTLARARSIQQSLLPDPLPARPDLELAARSEAAEEVGGDVYDALPVPGGPLGLAVADASGHGLPAALEARDVVTGLRMGTESGLKIEALVERLNRVLCRSALSSRFVSLIYGELDEEGVFEYVNAGHPPPLLITASGARALPEAGLVLGVSPDARYRVGRAQLPTGGLLLLYTDGVTECPSSSGEEFGVERLSGIASLLAHAPPAHLVAAIFEALQEHAESPSFPDDATLLAVRRT